MSMSITSFWEHTQRQLKNGIMPEIIHLEECIECYSKNISPENYSNLKDIEKVVKSQIDGISSTFQSCILGNPDNHLKPQIEILLQGLTGKMAEISKKIDKLNPKPALQPILKTALPTFVPTASKPAKTIGLVNRGQNCAYNSLLQFLSHISSLKNASELLPSEFAELKTLINEHLKCEQENRSSSIDSNRFRLLMVKLFRGSNGQSLFSLNGQEDAFEIFSCLMGRLDVNPFSSKMVTTRRYEKLGNPQAPDPVRLQETRQNPISLQSYSVLDNGLCSHNLSDENQILLDIKDKGHLSFKRLLEDFFVNQNLAHSEKSTYLADDNLLYDYKLLEERVQFQTLPDNLIVTLKRFPIDNYGAREKINAPIDVPVSFELPSLATTNSETSYYELDGFVQHRGANGNSGHYVAVLKMNDKWVEFNDTAVKELNPYELKSALQNTYFHHYHRVTNPTVNTTVTVASKAIELAEALKNYENNLIKHSSLEQFYQVLETSQSQEELKQAFSNLKLDCVSQIDDLIRLEFNQISNREFARSFREKDLLALKNLQTPWLSIKGKNIVEQLLKTLKADLSIQLMNLTVLKLESFQEMLLNPQTDAATLVKTFHLLDQKFNGKAIKQHLQEAYAVAAPKSLLEKFIRMLLSIKTPLISLGGGNLVEQMVHLHKLQIVKQKEALQKERLEAFSRLFLIQPQVGTEALAAVYKSLDKEIRDKLESSVWFAHKQKSLSHYGEQAILKNPRILLAIKEPILGNKKGNLLEQLIHQLS